ncbi:MAG: LptF/LptG family permease [Prevotella sp.]|mgnify:FL=1|uniref:LptF/LptG family permease n=1 Tax=uncultured Prevotella sp. TaxID=159272 RepID=UPI0025E467C2|nr:LptF/LptG family permease [Prevotella sp.]MCI7182908.1 LptF/LptG family permease [Prevotella sp.]
MFRIKKLDIFIAKQFGLLFVGTFFICQFVLMMQFLWRYIDTLVGKGLSMDVLAEFFWYMGLMLVPQALPLAILLSSLITFGNMGESSELTAIKAAGISLMQAFRSLIAISILICFTSLYFQNTIGPNANRHLMMMLLSMKQKSPELEIPEGIFYDGIPNSNIYVQKKDLNTGKLYGIMIYRMTGSYEDQAIILADSGMLQATAEKKHLLMTLWNGEWFENMQAQELAGNASVPYRRESFTAKRILLDYDGDFNMNDGAGLSNNAKAKGFAQITHDKDSISAQYDSIGRAYYNDDLRMVYALKQVSKKDSLRALALANTTKYNVDSAFARLSTDAQRSAISYAQQQVRTRTTDLDFKQMMTSDGDRIIRQHEIEWFSKISLALTCLVFFFIGAPLGAIIRKGGLGLPVLISVIVFIVFYILDNTGQTMAKKEMWTMWFGLGLAPAVLIPMAIFFTYKATNDSVVFNVEVYTDLLRRFLGLRIKRHVARKEVIINDPDYVSDYHKLMAISDEVTHYSEQHNLKHAPSWIRVFFRYEPDHAIAGIYEQLEKVIEDLSNSRDRTIINHLSVYPIMSVKAHTRPFERKWLNIVSAVLIPLGFVLYMRMWRYRLRLLRDLRTIKAENDIITERIRAIAQRDGLTL